MKTALKVQKKEIIPEDCLGSMGVREQKVYFESFALRTTYVLSMDHVSYLCRKDDGNQPVETVSLRPILLSHLSAILQLKYDDPKFEILKYALDNLFKSGKLPRNISILIQVPETEIDRAMKRK
jgi:hypothetical protein